MNLTLDNPDQVLALYVISGYRVTQTNKIIQNVKSRIKLLRENWYLRHKNKSKSMIISSGKAWKFSFCLFRREFIKIIRMALYHEYIDPISSTWFDWISDTMVSKRVDRRAFNRIFSTDKLAIVSLPLFKSLISPRNTFILCVRRHVSCYIWLQRIPVLFIKTMNNWNRVHIRFL